MAAGAPDDGRAEQWHAGGGLERLRRPGEADLAVRGEPPADTLVSVGPLSAAVGVCDLCARGGGELMHAVRVQQTSGARVEFRACDGCARALRRIAAAAVGLIRLVDGNPGPQLVPTAPEVWEGATGLPIHEFVEPLLTGGGGTRHVRAMGAERPDGTWVGWLEFTDPATGETWRTDRETTQPSRAALTYWALGVQPSYLEGAFRRSGQRAA